MGTKAIETDYQQLLVEGWERRSQPVRLIGLGVRLLEDNEQASERLPFSGSPSSPDPWAALTIGIFYANIVTVMLPSQRFLLEFRG